MKAVALLVLLAACGKDAPSSLTIAAKPPAIGQVSVADIDNHSTETMTLQGEDLTIEREQTERRRTETLEVSAVASTKVRVTYEQRTEHETADGKTQEKPSPVAGKTYVVWRDGAMIRATTDGGEAVSDDEQAVLADDHTDLGRMAQMEAMITGRTWKRGEAVHFTADELSAFDHENAVTAEGTQTTAATMTWTSLDAGLATFTSVMQVETDNSSVAMSTTITGTVRVEVAHARPVEISMSVSGRGTVLMGRAAGAALQITHRGTSRYTYQ